MPCRSALLLVFLAFGVPSLPLSEAEASQAAKPTSQHLPRQVPHAKGCTTVRGTVRLAHTNRPVAGVLLALETCSYGYLGALCGAYTGDSTRTDAQGHYEMRFYSQADKNYIIRFDPGVGRPFRQSSRFEFKTNAKLVGPDSRPDSREIRSDSVNIADFTPDFAPNHSKPIDLHLPVVGH